MSQCSTRVVDANKNRVLKSIARGERAIRQGSVASHADAKKVLRKWLQSNEKNRQKN